MRRVTVGVLLAIFAAGMFASAVESQRRRGRGRGRSRTKTQQVETPQSAAIAESLAPLLWGLTHDEVTTHFIDRLRDEYRPRLAKATDAIAEDRLRGELEDKVRAIRESYVRFDGPTPAWDSSFLADEYAHANSESMLVVRDDNSQNFYFFMNDRLWKWFKAFEAGVFAGRSFAQFAEATQERFGPAAERSGRLIDAGEERHWLEWQDEVSRLRAVDLTQFYGFYCLVFEEKATVERRAQLGVRARSRAAPRHALVDAVTSGGGASAATNDANQDIVDRITGKIRRREDSPEPSKTATKRPTAERPNSTRPGAAPGADPLSGVGL